MTTLGNMRRRYGPEMWSVIRQIARRGVPAGKPIQCWSYFREAVARYTRVLNRPAPHGTVDGTDTSCARSAVTDELRALYRSLRGEEPRRAAERDRGKGGKQRGGGDTSSMAALARYLEELDSEESADDVSAAA